MRILVQKFGGSSVADLECMKKVRGKVREALAEGYKLVVVLSARSGRTNALLEINGRTNRIRPKWTCC